MFLEIFSYNLMTSIERLHQFIESKGISKREFYLKAGLSNGFLDKTKNIGTVALEKMYSAYPDLDLIWLITGKVAANTPVSNAQVGEQVTGHSTNTPVVKSDGKVQIAAPATAPPTKFLAPQIISVNNERDENILYVPVRAAAGYLKGSGDPEYMGKLPAFNLPGLKKSTYRAFQVDGDSMFPTLESKEMIIGEWLEKLDDIREDHVHIVVTKTRGVIVKRLLNRISKYGIIIAKSDALDNRQLYPNIEIEPEDIQEIWLGVFHGGNKFKHPVDMYRRVNDLEADLTAVMRVLKQNNLLDESK